MSRTHTGTKKRRPKLVTLAEARRLLASSGGKARAKALTSERRREIAKKAITTRWAKARKDR